MSDYTTNVAEDLLGLVRRTTGAHDMGASNVLMVQFGNSAGAVIADPAQDLALKL